MSNEVFIHHPGQQQPPQRRRRRSSSSDKEGGENVYSRVKLKWQRAVRRVSGGSSASSASPSTSPPPPQSQSSIHHHHHQKQQRRRRTSVEKPSWGVQIKSEPHPILNRTRHLSLNRERVLTAAAPQQQVPAVVHHHHQHVLAATRSCKIGSEEQQRQVARRSMLGKTESLPLSAEDEHNCDECEDSHEEDNGEEDEEVTLRDFPFSTAFTYSLGKGASPFPCGSEAVMINSSLAHEAFQAELTVSAAES